MENLELQQEAQKLLNDFMSKKGMSKVKLSKKIGVSNAVLTFVSKGQWENVSDEMLLRIVNVLKGNKHDIVLINTDNFEQIQQLCKSNAKYHLMQGLIGDTGTGKTTGLTHYYRNTPNTYYVQGKSAMSVNQFFYSILQEMSVNYYGNTYDMLKRIADEVRIQNNPVLIIDEAGKLPHKTLLAIHDLREETFGSLGIILAGCKYFRKNLLKGVEKDKQGIPEFYSRIITWDILSEPTKVEVMEIFKVNGVYNDKLSKQSYSNFRDVTSEIIGTRLKEENLMVGGVEYKIEDFMPHNIE